MRWKIGLFLIMLTLCCLTEPGEFEERREVMVREQIESRGIESESVLWAMRKVPRHEFVPDELKERAYEDRPLPIGFGQTISQPYIVAYMTEVVEVGENERALEIGTGSGYQAAVLSELAKDVFTIEIIPELAEESKEKLSGYKNVEVKEGDGYYGWEENAPFDVIMVTAAANHVPRPLIEQLAPGGRMVIPVSITPVNEVLTLVLKDYDGNVSYRQLISVRFVPMTGQAQS